MKTPSALFSSLLIVFACIATPISLSNARTWVQCLRSGVIANTYSSPIYGPMVVPAGPGFGAAGKLAADHASLFFSAKDYLARGRMYDPHADPWGRTAETFPPHVVFLTAYGSAQLDFLSSALINNFGQMFLFVLVSAYFLRGGHTSWSLRIGGLAAAAFAVFCTPVGVTWFERAQTDLYCASAILLLLKGMRDDRWYDFALAGLIASIKWSSLPFFALAALPYLFSAAPSRPRKILMLGMSFGIPFLLLVFFGAHAEQYLRLVYLSERGHFDGAVGASLSRYFPRVVSKILPFTVPILYLLIEKFSPRRRDRLSSELLFWVTSGLVAASFGTTAYEYRLLSSLFILPLIMDGRSILFPDRHARYSTLSRIVAVGFLGYALRIETTTFVDVLISRGRGVIPLFVGLVLLLVCAVFESRSPAVLIVEAMVVHRLRARPRILNS
jgi:hypothetical protein